MVLVYFYLNGRLIRGQVREKIPRPGDMIDFGRRRGTLEVQEYEWTTGAFLQKIVRVTLKPPDASYPALHTITLPPSDHA